MPKTSQFRTLFLTLSIITLFSACGPTWKLRRAQKLIKLAEAEGATWKTDTLFLEKVIHVPGPSTEVQIPIYRDTTMVKDKIITVIRYLKGLDGRIDTVKVFTKCPDQEVKDTVSRVINRVISAPKENKVSPGWRTAAIIDGFLLLVLFVLIIRKMIK